MKEGDMNDESEHVPGGGNHYTSFILISCLVLSRTRLQTFALRLYVVNSCKCGMNELFGLYGCIG
jgi:hypothetical protein